MPVELLVQCVTSVVDVVGECTPVRLGARENIGLVRPVSDTFMHVAFFVHAETLFMRLPRRPSSSVSPCRSKLAAICWPLRIIPGPIADAIASVDCARTLRAEIRVPCPATGTWLSGRSRRMLAKRIRSGPLLEKE